MTADDRDNVAEERGLRDARDEVGDAHGLERRVNEERRRNVELVTARRALPHRAGMSDTTPAPHSKAKSMERRANSSASASVRTKGGFTMTNARIAMP